LARRRERRKRKERHRQSYVGEALAAPAARRSLGLDKRETAVSLSRSAWLLARAAWQRGDGAGGSGTVIDKTVATCAEAVKDVFDGATIMLGGFGDAGMPGQLIEALRQQGATNLVIISNGAGAGDFALGGMFQDGRIRRILGSFPAPRAWAFRERYLKREVELELMPQGTLVERIRAGGAGLGGFYTRSGVGTELAAGKEIRVIDGREYVFETPLHADFAFIKVHKADRLGNASYRLTMRNFNPIMATAADVVIAEADELVSVGALSPDDIETPGIFVDRVVATPRHPRLFEPAQGEAAI
jgi:3-oxoadipate CoA-transferase alpha subunit